MPQHDFNIANQLFPPTRADLNNALMALATNSSGPSAPSVPLAAQWWADTTNNVMKFRNNANDAWIELFELDTGTIVQPVTVEAVPVGTIVAWPGLFVPEKWHLCDGSVLNRTDYPGLFNALGTRFNTGGETSTQFRLPDLRGRSIFGRDNMGGTAAGRVTQGVSGVDGETIGARGGDQRLQQHTHVAFSPPHTHSLADPGHTHQTWGLGTNGNFGIGGSSAYPNSTSNVSVSGTGISISSTSVTVTVEQAGNGTSQNMPPSMILNYMIFTGGVGAEGDGGGGNVEPMLSNLEAFSFACGDETTPITTPGQRIAFRFPYDFVPTGVRITLNGAAATGTFTVSATVAGSPLLATQATIDATERTSKTAAVQPVLALSLINDDDEVIVSVDDEASGDAFGLKMIIYGYRVIA